VLPILAKSVGRLAAVWTDLSTPGQVWLTRGALSPLAVARDRHGAIWWASNPTWLRRMQQHLGIELGAIAMLHEGTLLVASIAKRRCDLNVAATYMPPCPLQRSANRQHRRMARIQRQRPRPRSIRLAAPTDQRPVTKRLRNRPSRI
jgi:hypothetical protein